MIPRVTAVIPSYNYGRFVAGAIDSVLAQTYGSIECIVVDDGSSDNTAEVLRAYEGSIRVVTQPNRGLSAARNAGIAAATGEFVAFLDADDRWHPEKISRQMRLFADRPDLGCVGCGFEHVVDDKPFERFNGRRNGLDRRETLRRIALRRFWVGGSGSGAVVRRAVFERVGGFDEALTAAEDWDMWMRLAVATEIDNVEAVSVSIVRHGTGVFRNVARMERNQLAAYGKAIAAWPDILSPMHRRQMRALILADAARESLGGQQRRDALAYYLRSLREWPFSYKQARAVLALAIRPFRAGFRRPAGVPTR